MSLSAADVQKVALLARLRLAPAELEAMTADLVQVVGYVDQLTEVDTANVEPMVHAIELRNVTKDDVAVASLPRGEALANAPNHNDEGYLVPAVLGD